MHDCRHNLNRGKPVSLSDQQWKSLTTPPPAMVNFVRRRAQDLVDEHNAEHADDPRHLMVAPALIQPLDGACKASGDAYGALTSDISRTGVSFFHTRVTGEPFLCVKLKTPKGDMKNLVIEVVDCSPVGLYYRVSGRFVANLPAPAASEEPSLDKLGNRVDQLDSAVDELQRSHDELLRFVQSIDKRLARNG